MKGSPFWTAGLSEELSALSSFEAKAAPPMKQPVVASTKGMARRRSRW